MKRKAYLEGIRDGIPIALGYFAVSFSLGIMAKKAGLTAIQGFFASLFSNASAGEYVVFVLLAQGAPYLEVFIVSLITNARYLLMSCALSQKFDPKTGILHRIGVGFDVTDEIFGISIARPGFVEPLYNYGAMTVCLPGWSLGTAFGIIAGSILPTSVVSALSVSLYGMFIAIVIPPARKDKFMAGLVALSFVSSYAFSRLPGLKTISDGTVTIILTILIAGAASIIKPIEDEPSKVSECEQVAEASESSDREVQS